jgi:ferredoxin
MSRLFLLFLVLQLTTVYGFIFPRIPCYKSGYRNGGVLFAKSYKVTIDQGYQKAVLDVPEDKSILEVALGEGLSLAYGCQSGTCLTCTAKIVSGTVDQSGGTLDDNFRQDGYALLCSAKPTSDVVVECIDDEERLTIQSKNSATIY